MAEKTGTSRGIPGEVKASRKVESAPLKPTKPQNLFTHEEGLGIELRETIDKKWEACWPVSNLRPLAVLDLICYLLFIKLLEDNGLITAKPNLKISLERHNPEDQLCWSGFKDLDGHALHHLFTIEKGIPDLLNNYGCTNLQFSKFVRASLLLRPTARLLTNVVDIIKIMDAEGGTKRALIFEHLLSKVEIEAQNGQVYAPINVVKLMVEMMQPTGDDLIWDPCAGNANFLINCATHIKLKNSSAINNFNENFYAGICTGIETDLIQLRIGAMNMILHSIENPKLNNENILEQDSKFEPGQSSLIMSNLFFDGASGKTQIVANKSQDGNKRQEIAFLNLILKNLKKGGRAAVLVPEHVLYNNASDASALRHLIVDEHKLETIITLPHSAGKIFSGGCILIIDDSNHDTRDKIWFYKMNDAINKTLLFYNSLNEDDALEPFDNHDNINDLLSRWKNKKQETERSRIENSFFVGEEEIKDHNYNLCFNEYRKVEITNLNNKPAEVPSVSKNKSLPLLITKRKFNVDVASAKLRLKRIKLDLPRLKFDQAKTKFDLIKARLNNLRKTKFHLPDIKFDLPKIGVALPKVKLHLPHLKSGQQLKPFTKKAPLFFVPASIIIFVVAITFYLIFFTNKNTVPESILVKNKVGPNDAAVEIKATPIVIVKNPAAQLTQQQIKAILYDTTGINHFTAEPNNQAPAQADSSGELNNNDDNKIQSDFENTAGDKTQSNEKNLQVKYKVVDTTFFHDEPVFSSKRNTFLDPLKNNVLNSLQDKNGFIYIVYTNALGRTSKGWISKKDLKPLR